METFAAKAKEPFKTALAMVIAYAIALSMDWDKAFWAAFAVAFVALSSKGQSFNKAAMRMLGTLVAIAVALALIALFAQQRWQFIIALSVYVGICTYLMTGTKHQYFWNVSGFVCVLLCMSAGPDPVNAFNTAILRAQETGLGILVYSLVATLLWPVNSRKDFFAVAGQIASGQRQFCQAGLTQGSQGDPAHAQALKGQLLQAQPQFQKLLDAAEADTQEVWEMRRYWRIYQEQTASLTGVIGSCAQNLASLGASNTPHLVNNLESVLAELDKRYAGIERLLGGKAPEQQPADIEPSLDNGGLKNLSEFEKAAVITFHSRLRQLVQLSRDLFETALATGGLPAQTAAPRRPALPALQWPDPDRMLAVVRVLLTLWMAYLAWIFVDSIPGSTTFVTIACVFGMIVVSIPMIPLRTILKPLMAGVVFGSMVYMLILPRLSGFISLGTLIFVTTFAICYFLSSPKLALAKTLTLAMFVSIASIDNQQTYSFMVVATNVLMFPLVFVLLTITAYFPVDLRQDKSFMRLLDRFFRSSASILSGTEPEGQQPGNGVARLRKAFHIREISSIPAKLAGWARFLDTRALPGTDAKDVQALIPRLQDLASHTRELVEIRGGFRNQYLIGELGDAATAWRHHLNKAFEHLGRAPSGAGQTDYNTRLNELLERLESKIRQTLDRPVEAPIPEEDGKQLYRLMGAYRGLTESLCGYAATASAINWGPWHEERF